MKKCIVMLMFAMAAVAFIAAPAAADIKVTTKGYMQVQGLYLSGHPVKNPGYTGSNNWYNMEMVLVPTLHVNDKVRIHAQIRMMERNYTGTVIGDTYGGTENNSKYNVWGSNQNNFWLERLYITFNLLGGTMNIGRMSGGNWANDFADSDQNRDRILYIRRVGPVTLLGLIEKLRESDGGLAAPRATNITNASYDKVDQDQDAYAIGAVVPLSKQIILRPLYYGIRDGIGVTGTRPDWNHLILFGGIFDFGVVRFETEIDYRWVDVKGDPRYGAAAKKYDGWAVWGALDFNMGPLKAGVSGFWLEGGNANTTTGNRTIAFNTGNRFQPLLLSFSEDMGLFYASSGVPNASADILSSSGYQVIYTPVSFKISDDMKVGGVFGYLKADKMTSGSKVGGGTASKELGWEVDVNFTWRFMDNISYIMDAGYFNTGKYFKDYFGRSTQNIYGIRNTIKVEW